MAGLVRVLNNQQLDEMRAAEAGAILDIPEEVESGLAAHIRRSWERNKMAKQQIERELLRCLRQSKGEYEPDKLQAIRQMGGSEIYMLLTAAKIRGLKAWLLDILRGTDVDGRPFGIEPTPIPDLPGWMDEAIAMRVIQTSFAGNVMDEQGQQVADGNPVERIAMMRDEALRAMREFADKAAERMESKIADQMEEGDWDDGLEDFIADFSTYPAAFMEGPVPVTKSSLSWEIGQGGNYQPRVSMKVKQHWERVSPFDAYPSPGAASPQDGDFIIRKKYSRRDLYGMLGQGGSYKDEAIRECLQDYGRGGLSEWLWTDAERAQLEHMDNSWLRTNDGMIDGLKYYGSVPGYLLLEWGTDVNRIKDPLAEYEVVAVLIGRHVIYCDINRDPLAERPVYSASFEPVAGAIWGTSLPYKMRDIQDVCNATARALVNNMGIASGPIGEINFDRLRDGEDPYSIYPWRMFATKSSPNGNNPALRFFQPDMHADALLKVYSEFEQRADDATNVPRYFYGGDQATGAGATASGLSMLMNASARGIKVSVFSIDTGLIRRTVRLTYRFNMLYDPDPTIKGDCNVIARGATAMLVKEQAQLRRQEFLGMTNNPVDMEIMGLEGRANVLREITRGLDMAPHKIVPPEEEFMARLAQKQQNQPPDPAVAKIKADQQIAAARLDADAQRDQAKGERERAATSERLALEREMKAADRDQEWRQFLARLDMEERLKNRQIDEDAARFAQQEGRAEREGENARADAKQQAAQAVADQSPGLARVLEIIEQVRQEIAEANQRERDEPPETAQPAAPLELHVHIDGKTGGAKVVKFDRDKTGSLAGATMTEQSE